MIEARGLSSSLAEPHNLPNIAAIRNPNLSRNAPITWPSEQNTPNRIDEVHAAKKRKACQLLFPNNLKHQDVTTPPFPPLPSETSDKTCPQPNHVAKVSSFLYGSDIQRMKILPESPFIISKHKFRKRKLPRNSIVPYNNRRKWDCALSWSVHTT